MLGGEYLRRYFEEMDELAKDIAVLLKGMAQSQAAETPQAAAQKPIVYVAESTSDLDDKLGEIRRDLKDRGYVVLPDGDLPYRADAYKQKVRELLKQAAMSVHLVGAGYGFVPEGETKSNVWLQYDLAAERGADPNFFRLIWTPKGIAASDQRQADFINHLNDEAGAQRGTDLLNGNIEELKTVIRDRIDEIRKRQEKPKPAASETASKRTSGEPLLIYVMCDAADRKSPSLAALRKYLMSQGCEPVLPSQSDTESDALQAHVENLNQCDGCVIFYGQGSPAWFDAKVRDLRKYLRGRQPPVAAKAIYLAEPATEQKNELETLEAMVLRESGAFSPDVTAPFVQALHTAVAA